MENYVTLKVKLEKAKLEFHTYGVDHSKIRSMIIKNLPPNLPIEKI